MNAQNAPMLDDFLRLRYSAGGQPFTRRFSQRLGAPLAWMAMRLGLSPNAVTATALCCSLAGALAYALLPPGTVAMVVCIAFTQLGYALDCADGQLARGTGRTSRLGAWFDVYCDQLVVCALSFAVLAHLLRTALPIAPEVAFVVMLTFTFGRVSSLYSSTMARIWDKELPPSHQKPKKRFLQELASLFVDTPVTLLFLCGLRDSPGYLLLFTAGSAALHILHGAYVGVRAARRSATSDHAAA